jgi:hypothetical protein
VLSEEEIPRTESLQDLVERTLPLWRKAFKKYATKILVLNTDKKENKIFLIYKEIHTRAVAKSYMTNGLLIYD